MINYEVEEKLSDTAYLVKANNFEYSVLWKENSSDWIKENKNSVKWEEINPGHAEFIGKINDRTIVISLRWARINGIQICFYFGISQLVDYKMIEDWFKINYFDKYNNRDNSCDADNFYNCLNYIREINKNV